MATRSWNRVELIGNLTRDPELRYTPQGTAVATFSIATNRSYVSDGERKEEVDFHRIVAWSKLAELCSQLLKKGMRVFVSGRLQNRSWEGTDGQQRNTTEIVIEDMIILTAKNGTLSSEPVEDISHGEAPPKLAASPSGVEEKEETGPTPQASAEAKKPEEETTKEKISDKELDDLPF